MSIEQKEKNQKSYDEVEAFLQSLDSDPLDSTLMQGAASSYNEGQMSIDQKQKYQKSYDEVEGSLKSLDSDPRHITLMQGATSSYHEGQMSIELKPKNQTSCPNTGAEFGNLDSRQANVKGIADSGQLPVQPHGEKLEKYEKAYERNIPKASNISYNFKSLPQNISVKKSLCWPY